MKFSITDQSSYFQFPKKNKIGRFFNYLLNSKSFLSIKKIILKCSSRFKLKSDVKNVVYLNWLIPLERVQHLIPETISLEQHEGKVLFSILTYKHGNFRPQHFNKLKFLFGSPLQSNWRFYINYESSDKGGTVFFFKNILSNLIHVIGSRLMSNILQAHYPLKFKHAKNELVYTTIIESGHANFPSLEIKCQEQESWEISDGFKTISSDVQSIIETICNHDFAVGELPIQKDRPEQFTLGKIKLNFNVGEVKPLKVIHFKSLELDTILKDLDCFAFVIPELSFSTLGEKA